MEDFICKKCGNTTYIVQEKTNGTGIATGLYCSKCGTWHKWLNKQEKVLYSVREKSDKDKEIVRLIAENAELKARLEKAVEIPNVFNKDIIVILYDEYKIPNLYNAKVVGLGVDTYALYERKIDIIITALCKNGDVHFLHGRQYKNEWFLIKDRSEAEARLAELKGGTEKTIHKN